MNRIILIGNGFDLAHGIKSSYIHFIDDFWENTIKEIKDHEPLTTFKNDEIKIDSVPSRWEVGSNYEIFVKNLDRNNSSLDFNNKFLKRITNKSYLQNWVDIENEYYDSLKETFQTENCDFTISELNSDFEKIKNLLKTYLIASESEFGNTFKNFRLKYKIRDSIYSNFKLKDFSESLINEKTKSEYESIKKDLQELRHGIITMDMLNNNKRKILSQLNDNIQFSELRKLLSSEDATDFFDLVPEQILFLNFNYTYTESLYTDYQNANNSFSENKIITKTIHIHGTLDKKDNNPMIFGFGDEIDNNYKHIENLNNNTYLKNIKSINYLETDQYKQLLEFINSNQYQIFIFGHSCGISDRTLLNSLFEHENCVSIKPFYHKKSESEDNYSDVIRNISRNFNNKAIMRDKVVNKKYCEPLV